MLVTLPFHWWLVLWYSMKVIKTYWTLDFPLAWPWQTLFSGDWCIPISHTINAHNWESTHPESCHLLTESTVLRIREFRSVAKISRKRWEANQNAEDFTRREEFTQRGMHYKGSRRGQHVYSWLNWFLQLSTFSAPWQDPRRFGRRKRIQIFGDRKSVV